jgi:hypothetical protein
MGESLTKLVESLFRVYEPLPLMIQPLLSVSDVSIESVAKPALQLIVLSD